MDALVPVEWDRLVRLCAHLSGSTDAADDLAQETLVEAWRHADTLRDQEARPAWLSGIARNVCLRWRRQRAREIERHDRLMRQGHLESPTNRYDDLLAGLERDEIADLLERALNALPKSTRDVLVLRYVEELRNREIASRLSLGEGEVAVRLHRGRMALQRALAQPELRAEAIDMGIVTPDTAGWHETRIWCPFCGQHRVEMRIEPDTQAISCRCTGSCIGDGTIIGGKRLMEQSRTLTSMKSILSRELLDLHRIYREILDTGTGRCEQCGRSAPVESWSDTEPDGWDTLRPYGIRIACQACGAANGASLWHLLIDSPEGQRFWRRQPRMRALPVREVEVDGRAALVSGFASLRGAERVEIVTARDTREILHVDGAHGG